MMEFLKILFSSGGFMPHGHCLLWKPSAVWLNVISDSLITLAYYSISLILLYFVRKKRDLAFPWMFLMFGAFIPDLIGDGVRYYTSYGNLDSVGPYVLAGWNHQSNHRSALVGHCCGTCAFSSQGTCYAKPSRARSNQSGIGDTNY